AAYVEAKFLAGDLPKTAKTDSGESLSGYALVAYVIGTDGHASGLAVIETTEPRLEPFVAQAMHDWRFTPASIDGKPVAIAAAQEIDVISDVHVTPTEFVTQVLEPTGGKIDKPKGWFYAESRDAHSFLWTLSRERAAHGYETGMRIQVLVGIQEN